MFFLIPLIYVIVHDPSGDVAKTYEGMPQATVASLLQEGGSTYDFISQKAYEDFVAAHKRTRTVDPTAIRAKADINDKKKTDAERIDAIVKYLGLDK